MPDFKYRGRKTNASTIKVNADVVSHAITFAPFAKALAFKPVNCSADIFVRNKDLLSQTMTNFFLQENIHFLYLSCLFLFLYKILRQPVQ